jgi:putative Mn2+ efflux pump MntP
MATEAGNPSAAPWWHVVKRKNVLAGLMFMAVAALALWLSRDYPIGTALRMGTGYVPRLLAWILLLLGLVILIQDLRARSEELNEEEGTLSSLRPIFFVTLSIVAFGLTIERLGLFASTVILAGIGSLAAQNKRPLETLIAAFVMAAISVAIFIVGLGLTIPIWPEW